MLVKEYDHYMVVHLGDAWREKWPQSKLAIVDHSLQWDVIRAGRVKAHLKREVLREKVTGKLPTKARMIQAYETEADSFVIAQRYDALAYALKRVSAETHVRGHIKHTIRYAAGMNHQAISDLATKWDRMGRFRCVLFYERDGVNWDSTRQKPVKHYLADGVYAKIDQTLGEHARSGIKCTGVVCIKKQGTLKYEVDGTTKSGHRDTSSGNSADNMECAVSAVESLPDFLYESIEEVEGLVMGDDLWLAFLLKWPVDTDAFLSAMVAGDQACGIEPEARIFTNVLDTSFISMSFYPAVDGTIIAGPKVGRMLSGLYWTHQPVHPKLHQKYITAVSQVFLHLFGDCPLVGRLLRQHINRRLIATAFLEDFDKKQAYWASQFVTEGHVDWDQYFTMRYGLLPGWHKPAERAMRTQKCAIIQSLETDIIIDQDLADIGDRWLWGKSNQ